MAYDPNELMQTATGLGSGKRIFPTSVQPKTFASAAGAELLAVGQVVAFNTTSGFWMEFDADSIQGADTIKGIVFPDAIQLDATNEVLGQVMLTGRAHIGDLISGGQATDNEMIADLQANARDIGIIIEGLDAVR